MILVITCIIVIFIIIIFTLLNSHAVKKVQGKLPVKIISIRKFLADVPQKSKNGNHGLPNPNNISDISDHPFRIVTSGDNVTETTTLISYMNPNTTIGNFTTVT